MAGLDRAGAELYLEDMTAVLAGVMEISYYQPFRGMVAQPLWKSAWENCALV